MSIADIFKKFGQSSASSAKDPICGMKVDLEKTKYKSEYRGKTYGFCSLGCKQAFDENPERYA